MHSHRTALLSAMLIAALAAGCSGAATPSDLPSESPSSAPTIAPTPSPSDVASPEASAPAETVLSFDEIDVEALSAALVNGGWFDKRTDNVLDGGDQQILLLGTKSEVVLSIVHDGAGNLIRVSTYDANRFDSDESLFDLGVVSGILLGETLGTELVLWHDSLRPADSTTTVIETRTFGPDDVTVAFGQEGSPNDGFVFFEPAN